MKLKYTLVFTIISFFISTAGFAQQYTDEEIGLNVEKLTVALKEHGVKNEEITSEIARLRSMKLIEFIQTKKEQQTQIVKESKIQQSSKSLNSKIAVEEITDIPASEKAVLQALYDNNGGVNWSNRSGWDFSTPVTSWNFQTQTGGWYGITVANGHVVGIRLVRQNITGILPDLSPLTYLKELNVGNNNLTPQNIPSWITNLNNLEQLNLGTSNFIGDFPNLSSLQKLTHLTLSQNSFNVSAMPSWFTQLPDLFTLEVFDCKFKGSIPDLSSLNKLRYLKIGFNDFSTETIPLWLNNMPQLFQVDISVSQLKGELPDLSNLTSLIYFNFSYNQLTGPIPNYFNNFPNLNYISLYNNQLTGPLPEVSNLKNLRQLSFNNNQITGNIPDLSGAINLESINFSNNKLTGTIPDLSSLNLTYLNLGFNQLSGPIPNLKPIPNFNNLLLGSNQLTGTLPDLSQFTGLYAIDFSFNKLTGSVPSYAALQNLNTLRIDNNQLSGNIPSLTGLTSLSRIDINHNKFRFVDFVDQFNFLNARSFGHSPQATIDIPQTFDKKTGESVTFKMCLDDILHPQDTFQWYRNGTAIINATGQTYTIDNLSLGLSGTYTCISNHNLPGMKLALVREPIILNVTCPDVVGTIKMDKEDNEVDTDITFSFETTSTNLTYYWNFYNANGNNVFHAETLTATPSFSEPGIYTLKFTIMDKYNSSCRIDLEKTFTIKPKPCVPLSGTITTSTENIFPNTSILFSFDRSLENPTYYEWTFFNLDKTSSTTIRSSSYRFSYDAVGTYEVHLKITDKYGCESNFQKTITVTQKPPCVSVIGTLLPTQNNFLTDSNITFSLNTSSTGFGYNWTFYKPDGSFDSSTNSTVIKSFSEAGNYTVRLITMDIYGCTTIFNKTISITKAGCVPITGNIRTSTPDVFVGRNTNFSLETTATDLSYKWTFSQGNESTIFTTKTADYIYIQPGTNNVILEVTDSNGCKTTFQKLVELKTGSTLCNDVTQFGRAFVQVGADNNLFKAATVSVNQTTNITFSSQNYGPAADFEYKWSLLNENNQLVDSGTNLNFPITPTRGGLYTVVLDLKENTTGCIHQFTRAIVCTISNSCTQTNPESATVKGLVINLLKNLMARAMMGESDAQINSSIATAEFNALKPYITSGPKDKIYNFTSTRNLNGEFTTVAFSFSPDRVSDIYISVPHGLQYSQGMPLDYLQSSMIEPKLYIDLSQYTSANQYLISCLSDSQSAKGLLKPNDCVRASEIRYINFCPGNCNTFLGSIKTNSENISLNTPVSFSVETTATVLNYNWTFYNSDNTVKETLSSATPTQTYTVPGTYKVVVMATDSNNCPTTFTKNINITAPPCIAAIGTIKTLSPNIFVGSTIDFYFDTTATNLTYEWTFATNVNSGAAIFTTNTAKFYYSNPGNYTVKLIVTDANGCKNTFRKTITAIVKPPCVNAIGEIKTANPIISTNENTTFSFETTATNLRYNWTFHSLNNTPLLNTSDSNPTLMYPYANDYKVTLIVMDENDCPTTFEKTITVVRKCPVIPGSANIPETVSSGQIVPFEYNTTSNGVSYSWTFYNLDGSRKSIATTSKVNRAYYTPGNYRVTLEVNDLFNSGCKTTIDKIVTVTGQCGIQGTIASNPAEGISLDQYVYFWFESEAIDLNYKWTVTTPDNVSSQYSTDKYAPYYFQSGSGTYKIAVEISDGNECTLNIEKTYNIEYDCSRSTGLITGSIYNNNHKFYYSSDVLIDAPNKFTFWHNNSINENLPVSWELTDLNGTHISSGTEKEFIFTPTTSAGLILKLTITDQYGCPHYFSKELNVVGKCQFYVSDISGDINFDEEYSYKVAFIDANQTKDLIFRSYDENDGKVYTYQWNLYDLDDTLVSSGSQQKFPITLTKAGYYKVTLDIIDPDTDCPIQFTKKIGCVIYNSCTENNPKSQIVKDLYLDLIRSLIIRSSIGETDEQINNSEATPEFIALKPYITNGPKDKIYNFKSKLGGESGNSLEGFEFSFSPERQSDVYYHTRWSIFFNPWDVENSTDRINQTLYLALNQYVSADQSLVSCYVDYGGKMAGKNVNRLEEEDCVHQLAVRYIDFCPAEDCTPITGTLKSTPVLGAQTGEKKIQQKPASRK